MNQLKFDFRNSTEILDDLTEKYNILKNANLLARRIAG